MESWRGRFAKKLIFEYEEFSILTNPDANVGRGNRRKRFAQDESSDEAVVTPRKRLVVGRPRPITTEHQESEDDDLAMFEDDVARQEQEVEKQPEQQSQEPQQSQRNLAEEIDSRQSGNEIPIVATRRRIPINADDEDTDDGFGSHHQYLRRQHL
jgi:hypothetical protein